MDSVLQDLDFLFVYLDDVLVASRDNREHKQHLNILFDRLEDHSLVVKPKKCQFGVTEIDFLGHWVSKDGIKPLTNKLEAIKVFPTPMNIKSLERFL